MSHVQSVTVSSQHTNKIASPRTQLLDKLKKFNVSKYFMLVDMSKSGFSLASLEKEEVVTITYHLSFEA